MYSWKDKLIDWANQRGAWTRILMAVGITMLIVAIILGAAMPSKGVVETNKVDIGGLKNTMDDVVDGLATKASHNELEDLSETVTNALGDQAADISDVDERTRIAEEKLTQARTDIAAIQEDVAGLTYSPPEGYLTGAFGNYTLHAKSNDAGNFTARVHLVYSPMVVSAANQTAAVDGFYGSVDWSVNATIPGYVPVVAFDGTTWGINEIWWNVGIFELAAKTEKAIDITCAGLNSTWEPSYVYVEVWPVIQ